MAGLLSGLAALGLGKLADKDIFQEEKKVEKKPPAPPPPPKIEEKDLIFERNYTCPVCDRHFTSKTMKTGKAKLLGMDPDLRPRYDHIDANKYDVVLCPKCGYAALARNFTNLSSGQAKLIRENISENVHLHVYNDDIYTYQEAIERYQMCLANAMVKRSRASEKAFICLKSAWLFRGCAEQMAAEENTEDSAIEELKKEEESFLLNAYNGFVDARQSEGYPMCGMDEMTVDYLLASLATHFKKYDVASKLISSILSSVSASARVKGKARELKEQIIADIKKTK